MKSNVAICNMDFQRKAQADPEHHGDILVRVWGFSAKFVELAPEMQDHIISRALSSET